MLTIDIEPRSHMRPRSHYLSKHVYMCYANRHLVFLDLRRDKYLCLDQVTSSAVALALQEPPAPSITGEPERAVVEPGPDDVLATLAGQQLITADQHRGKQAAPACIAAPTEALMSAADTTTPPLRLRHVVRFFAATVHAAARLRWFPIERTVERIRRKKAAAAEHGTISEPERLRELVGTFGALRPFFPRNYLCLFDSLALMEYLARFGVFPTWVFAVRMDPFGAHCWVQEGGIVLNDAVEHVRDYTPIMIV